ncbi:MAG: signal peptidase I, partial [Anaerolineales bacterium]
MENFHTQAFPDPINPEDEHSGFLRFVVDVFETVILSLILFLAINTVSARIRVDGYSMEPTLHTGEFVIVSKVSYRLGEPTRGDIVVFHFPRNPDQEYIKRVIGLPGDEVSVRNGQVYVNGTLLDETYIKSSPAYAGNWVVPDDSLFVLGDNRNNSSDSHNWGVVDLDLVIGKAVFVYWPPTEWGVI